MNAGLRVAGCGGFQPHSCHEALGGLTCLSKCSGIGWCYALHPAFYRVNHGGAGPARPVQSELVIEMGPAVSSLKSKQNLWAR